jgi:hypothetical protein
MSEIDEILYSENHKRKKECLWLQHTRALDIIKIPNLRIHGVEEESWNIN